MASRFQAAADADGNVAKQQPALFPTESRCERRQLQRPADLQPNAEVQAFLNGCSYREPDIPASTAVYLTLGQVRMRFELAWCSPDRSETRAPKGECVPYGLQRSAGNQLVGLREADRARTAAIMTLIQPRIKKPRRPSRSRSSLRTQSKKARRNWRAFRFEFKQPASVAPALDAEHLRTRRQGFLPSFESSRSHSVPPRLSFRYQTAHPQKH